MVAKVRRETWGRAASKSAAVFVAGVLVAVAAAATDAQPGGGGAGSTEAEAPTGVQAAVSDVSPLGLTDEMKAFVEEKVGLGNSRQARLLGLQDAIFDPKDGLGVTYGSASTNTAAGTFERRSGNCLSFTLLFVALARHLNLETYFVEVDEVTGWSQRGEIGLSHWHMYAEVEVDGQAVPVDFLPWTERRYRSSRRISEERVRAHYHNNVGADLITAGDPSAALLHFARALTLDSTFNPARINMAVALRRNQELEQAETLLLEVLESESNNSVAAANLATLYVEQGRHGEAKEWLARREAFLNRNPFHHFRLGMQASANGDYAQASDHFKRAISRQRDEAVFFEQLAEAQFRLGATRKARSNLRRALHFTESPERRRLIENRLRSMAQPGDERS